MWFFFAVSGILEVLNLSLLYQGYSQVAGFLVLPAERLHRLLIGVNISGTEGWDCYHHRHLWARSELICSAIECFNGFHRVICTDFDDFKHRTCCTVLKITNTY